MGCRTVSNACETFEQQFPCCPPPQALDAAELEKDQLRRGQHTRSPVCSDWHSVVPPSDCTPPPEPLASPHLVVSSGEDNTSYTTISISPPAATDGTQDNAVNTASVNGEPQGSGAPPDGGNGESAAPSSGRCAGPWSPPAPPCSTHMQTVLFFMFKADSVFEDVVDTLSAEAQVVGPEEGEHQLAVMDNGTGQVWLACCSLCVDYYCYYYFVISANYQSKPLYLLLMSFFDVVILKVWTLLLLQMSSHLT